MLLASWNELLLCLPQALHGLRFKPDVLGHPYLVRKLIQDQTSECRDAQQMLGLQTRPLREMLAANYKCDDMHRKLLARVRKVCVCGMYVAEIWLPRPV
jgi:hypothetical protein